MKISLLEKKVDSADSVITTRVEAEREETEKIKQALENQEMWVNDLLSLSA